MTTIHHGYLRISVDAKQLHIAFHRRMAPALQSNVDQTTVDLASHTMVSNWTVWEPTLGALATGGQLLFSICFSPSCSWWKSNGQFHCRIFGVNAALSGELLTAVPPRSGSGRIQANVPRASCQRGRARSFAFLQHHRSTADNCKLRLAGGGSHALHLLVREDACKNPPDARCVAAARQ